MDLTSENVTQIRLRMLALRSLVTTLMSFEVPGAFTGLGYDGGSLLQVQRLSIVMEFYTMKVRTFALNPSALESR